MAMVQQLSRELPAEYCAEPRVHLEPTLAVDVDLAEQYEYEVLVYDQVRGRTLVAAVEIVSPANKDRPENRQAFVAKLNEELAVSLDLETSYEETCLAQRVA